MAKLRDQVLERRRTDAKSAQGIDSSINLPLPTAHVRAEGCSGLRHIKIRDFQLFNDVGPNCAGFDLGPTQYELLLGAIGSCLTQTFLERAAERGVAINHVEVDVTGDPGTITIPSSDAIQPPAITYRFTVDSPASHDTIEYVRLAAEQTSPLLSLLMQPHAIRGTMIKTSGSQIDSLSVFEPRR